MFEKIISFIKNLYLTANPLSSPVILFPQQETLKIR